MVVIKFYYVQNHLLTNSSSLPASTLEERRRGEDLENNFSSPLQLQEVVKSIQVDKLQTLASNKSSNRSNSSSIVTIKVNFNS